MHNYQLMFDTRWPLDIQNEYDLIKEDNGELYLYIDALGYGENDIKVELVNGFIYINGTLPKEKQVSSLVKPSISLTYNTQLDDAEATLDNGLLKIRLFKREKDIISIPIMKG